MRREMKELSYLGRKKDVDISIRGSGELLFDASSQLLLVSA